MPGIVRRYYQEVLVIFRTSHMSGILPRGKFDVRETTNNVRETTNNPGYISDFAQPCPEYYLVILRTSGHSIILEKSVEF